MKYVRPIFMHEYPCRVVMIVGIAADMVALVNYQHFFVGLASESLGDHASCESGSNYQVIEGLVVVGVGCCAHRHSRLKLCGARQADVVDAQRSSICSAGAMTVSGGIL